MVSRLPPDQKRLLFFCSCVAMNIFCAFSADTASFLSIDCGLLDGDPSYTDNINITWVGDAGYVHAGKTATVRDSDVTYRPWTTLRYFPKGRKNCYSVRGFPVGTKLLMRAMFIYRNYDGFNGVRNFDVLFDGNHWESMEVSVDYEYYAEAIYVTRKEIISICLLRTNSTWGDPFISTLEFRTLPAGMYPYQDQNHALALVDRVAFTTANIERYPSDPYDRLWMAPPLGGDSVTILNISATKFDITLPDSPPAEALKCAMTPKNKSQTYLQVPTFYLPNTTYSYYFNLYFSEVYQNTRRTQIVRLNDTDISEVIIPPYGNVAEFTCTNCSLDPNSILYLVRPESSLSAPILNAYEYYRLRPSFTTTTTDARDMGALSIFVGHYTQLQAYSGDPCLPQNYNWEWLNCSAATPPRVTELHLSGYGLMGSLPDFSAMNALQIIELSNNSLEGDVPEFLASFPDLIYLNVLKSGLTGCLQSTNNKLHLRLIGSQLCISTNNGNDKDTSERYKGFVIVGACLGPIVVLVIVALCFIKRGKHSQHSTPRSPPPPQIPAADSFEDEQNGANEQKQSLQSELCSAFSYSEVVAMTNNFNKLIGKGGSGEVYYGRLKSDNEVAVKVLANSSPRENEMFLQEVRLLMKVHHGNLAPFVGFCEEGDNKIVLYEYMKNGNMGEVLAGKRSNITELLTWKRRLQVAVDVATGLDYLHSGCQPFIIHRDVKSTNILLSENLQAKLTDFGISKVGDPTTRGTSIVGTPGYIDPEYVETSIVTRKSDIYSFGVVLFELMCGRPAAVGKMSEEQIHIVPWATSMLLRGDIVGIVDPKIVGQYNIKSVWKVALVAVSCTARKSSDRPNMDEVVIELKEAMEMENGRRTEDLTSETICTSESALSSYSESPVPR